MNGLQGRRRPRLGAPGSARVAGPSTTAEVPPTPPALLPPGTFLRRRCDCGGCGACKAEEATTPEACGAIQHGHIALHSAEPRAHHQALHQCVRLGIIHVVWFKYPYLHPNSSMVITYNAQMTWMIPKLTKAAA